MGVRENNKFAVKFARARPDVAYRHSDDYDVENQRRAGKRNRQMRRKYLKEMAQKKKRTQTIVTSFCVIIILIVLGLCAWFLVPWQSVFGTGTENDEECKKDTVKLAESTKALAESQKVSPKKAAKITKNVFKNNFTPEEKELGIDKIAKKSLPPMPKVTEEYQKCANWLETYSKLSKAEKEARTDEWLVIRRKQAQETMNMNETKEWKEWLDKRNELIKQHTPEPVNYLADPVVAPAAAPVAEESPEPVIPCWEDNISPTNSKVEEVKELSQKLVDIDDVPASQQDEEYHNKCFLLLRAKAMAVQQMRAEEERNGGTGNYQY